MTAIEASRAKDPHHALLTWCRLAAARVRGRRDRVSRRDGVPRTLLETAETRLMCNPSARDATPELFSRVSDVGPPWSLSGATATDLPQAACHPCWRGRARTPQRSTRMGPSSRWGAWRRVDVWLDDPAVSAFHVELVWSGLPHGGVLVKRTRAAATGARTSPGGIRITEAVVPPGTMIMVGRTDVARRSHGRARPHRHPELASFGRLRASSAMMRSLFAVPRARRAGRNCRSSSKVS